MARLFPLKIACKTAAATNTASARWIQSGHLINAAHDSCLCSSNSLEFKKSRSFHNSSNLLLITVPRPKFDAYIHYSSFDYDQIGSKLNAKELQPAPSFPDPPFPIKGIFYGSDNRMMVNLVCRMSGSSHHINVFFVLITGSSVNYLRQETIYALCQKKLIIEYEDDFEIPVEMQFPYVKPEYCYHSNKHFTTANILGMDVLRRWDASIKIDGENKCFIIDSKKHG